MTVFDRLRFTQDRESPRIKGSRISAVQLYEMHVLRGLTIKDLRQKFQALTEEDIEQALTYCKSHPDEVRKQATSPLTTDIVERQSRSKNPASA